MAPIKIYPPTKLPEKGVTDLLFNIWVEEIEVYLSQDDRFTPFMRGGPYSTWLAYDANADRIAGPQGEDAAADLPTRRAQLRTFLSIVAKACDINHYNVVTRHSTSLQWIYDKLREDYDIQQKGIHFFNLLDLQYKAGSSVMGFYNEYRNVIIANLKKRGDEIRWLNETLNRDEKLSPTFEDLILINVLGIIDARLPLHVRDHYHHHIGRDKTLMDYKSDILVKVPVFLSELDNKAQNNAMRANTEEHLGAMRFAPPARGRQTYYRGRSTPRGRGAYRGPPTTPMGGLRTFSSPYCRICHVTGQPDHVVRSHRIGDMSCPKLSAADKEYISMQRDNPRVNAITANADASDIADEYGYVNEDATLDYEDGEQVSQARPMPTNSCSLPPTTSQAQYNTTVHSRNTSTKPPAQCNFIQPVSSQILTLHTANKQVIHVELDSNATINYIKLDAAKFYNFAIKPNSQLSLLADGITKLPAIGEIHETFFRNDWSVKFSAVVVKTLHTSCIGGTVFLRDNAVKQDFATNNIQVLGKYTIPSTSPAMVMPIQPQNHLCKITTSGTILPGQDLTVAIPFSDNHVVAVEAGPDSPLAEWPTPQLCTVHQGFITIKNNSSTPIIRGKDIKVIQIRPTTTKMEDNIAGPITLPLSQPVQSFTEFINFNTQGVSVQTVQAINQLHNQYSQVFDKNLATGYNGAFGPHTCRLNWAGDTRPTATGVRSVCYSHDLKQLHQQVCDELTQQQVLGIPQDFQVNVQYVCPSFLRRKPKAKGKANHLLTKDDVRLVVNFSPVNDHLKNIPSTKTTTNDVLIALGRWKVIIVFDLHQGFFQNHMDPDDCKWLGIATPFGGVRFLRRSGQGLLGQSEELEELLTKILKEELQQGKCCKIADDIFVGGQTHEEVATTYAAILQKLHQANLKVSAKKTHIFPKTADILGWTWKQGGRLLPSPHRQLALKNTRQEDVTTIKDLRSWVGLYKTLLIATPQLAQIMDPFDQETASKESRDPVTWTDQLSAAFKTAKNHIDNVQELYLPSPHDQLLLVPDGAQKTPGIGHVLYAVVDGQRKPVRFHSVKLPDHCKKWSPCEIEALAFATGIQAEMDIIKESHKPLLIAPDSTPVKDAVNLIKKGKFSASARMTSFITNINRVQIEVVHTSGKANLNAVSDMQSRNPSTCTAEHCTICNFVTTSIDTVLNPAAILGAITTTSLYNPKAWAAAQKSNTACKTATEHLRTGKQPSKKSGAILSEIRRYCSIAKISKEGCLIVPQPATFNGQSGKDRLVIPTPLIPSVLWHLHNAENHPTKTQLRQMFDKLFYGIMVQNQLDALYQDCYQCKASAPLPKQCTNHVACTEVSHPGHFFHADIIRRERQKIFIIRDNFSSLTSATLVPSEQSQDLKEAIISLTSPIRLADSITVRVDAATGFQALKHHPDITQLGIIIQVGDTHNKNSNAVVDKACLELETEINKLQPTGGTVTLATLAQAILLLNQKIRRSDKLTATEIHFARDRITKENIILDDSQIRQSQLNSRHLSPPTSKSPQVMPGDTVLVTNKPPKHHNRDFYLVTSTEENAVSMQKITPGPSGNINLQPKIHTTTKNLLHPVYKSNHLIQPAISQPPPPPVQPTPPSQQWTPFQPYFQQEDSDTESTEDGNSSESEDSSHSSQGSHHHPQPISPNPLERHLRWLDDQRRRAQQALAEDDNAIVAFRPPPPPTPPPQPPLPPRAAKTAAARAIQQLGAKPRPDYIPQLEGAEPTPESTPEVTHPYNHHLSPQEPWSPVSFLHQASYEDTHLGEQYLHDLMDWPSVSSVWTGEDKASLIWDDPYSPPLYPTLENLIPPLSPKLDLPLIFQQAQQQAHFDRRYTFGGFDIIPFPKRQKISQPDYSVWNYNPPVPSFQ